MNFFEALFLITISSLQIQQNQTATADNITLISAKVVKETQEANWDIRSLDFTAISARLHEQRLANNVGNQSAIAAPAPFIGPPLLNELVERCFLFDDKQKYIFRVCPFANVTQHEKSEYAFNFLTTSFHAVLGVYRHWYVKGDDESQDKLAQLSSAHFDSLLYLQGDQCDQGISRKVRLNLLCSSDWTMVDLAYVVNVSEVEKCLYQATLASSLFCQLGSVHSRLDSSGKAEWNVLQSLYSNGQITEHGYKHYLEMLLNRYGLTSRDETATKRRSSVTLKQSEKLNYSNATDVNIHLECEQRIQQLEKQVAQLKERNFNCSATLK